MDFSNRNAQPQTAPSSTQSATPSASSKKTKKTDNGLWGRVAVVAGVVAIFVLIASVAVFAGTSGEKREDSYVNDSKLQAVFLNTGQVYFGNIKTLNNEYLVLSNIYYLQTSNTGTDSKTSANSNANVSLVKLGCELHEPLDQMVINRDQVTFWENLGDNGQVATAVAAFKKQNPDGQKCADQSTSSSTNSSSNVQNAGNSNSSTNSSSTSNP